MYFFKLYSSFWERLTSVLNHKDSAERKEVEYLWYVGHVFQCMLESVRGLCWSISGMINWKGKFQPFWACGKTEEGKK